jgi:D-alanyl-lipoteichoic acid acyltransferase DltB (MBOAT superfamily)
MLFPTFTFGVFLLFVTLGHAVVRRSMLLWKPFMVIASFVFYGWFDVRLTALLGGSIIFNWAVGTAIDASHTRPREIVAIGVAINLGVLAFFKYFLFFTSSLTSITGTNGPAIAILLPIGISFFTFQGISYLVDIHRRQLPAHGLIDVALYLAFFPQLVAGPIVRATEFLPQIERRSIRPTVASGEAAWMIGQGLFKKVVVANYLAQSVVDPVFDAPNRASQLELITAFYGYAIQIYADFSGYTDIAIGIALLLGFDFPKNFNAPYRSLSITEFWRRWHMTLSRWLRDYLYIPLGGSRRGKILTYRNLFITMLLGGLWHGAQWNFVVWGAIHGGWLMLERLRGGFNFHPVLRWIVTFHVVCIAWVLFRAPTFGHAEEVLRGLVTADRGLDSVNWVAWGMIVTALLIQLQPLGHARALLERFARWDPLAQAAALACWVLIITAVSPPGLQPFIYFQF